MATKDTNSTYFAAREGKETANVLLQKGALWLNNIDASGYREKLRMMYNAYYGAYYSSTQTAHTVSFSGEQGELAQLPVNHFRNLAQHMLIATTSNRPSMEARAVNTDYKSLAQTHLANGILDYYMREKRLEKYLKIACEYSIFFGAGFIKMEWNATAGDVYDTIENEDGTTIPLYDGDIEFSNLSPLDVLMDSTKESQNHDWIMARTAKNRFDLIAKWPEYEEKILALPSKADMDKYSFGINALRDETDDVYIYEFFHKKSDSLPNGRYMMFVADDVVLSDGPMPYRILPIFRIAPSEYLGTPFGYSGMFDILPIQESLNSLYSAVLTNQTAFAVQNLWSKSGNNLNYESLAGGLNLIESNEPPQVLQLCKTPEETFTFINLLEKVMETLSGVNSVTRGNADSLGSNPSGTALALIQSMSLQFMSGLQGSYVALIEDVGSAVIKVLQDYANSPRLVAIAGKSQRTYMKEFTGKDIANISRVIVDVGNPLSRTTAGRTQMASELLQYGNETNKITPDQYITLINTGKLEVMTEEVQRQEFCIRAENEMFTEGEKPIAIDTDDHRKHITSHRGVLSDPDSRKDPELVARVLEHIQEHIIALRMADPDFLTILGQQPLTPPGMPPMAPGAPGEEGAGAPPGMPMPPMEGQQGPTPENGMAAPGMEGGTNLPEPPQVDPSLTLAGNAPGMPPQGQ